MRSQMLAWFRRHLGTVVRYDSGSFRFHFFRHFRERDLRGSVWRLAGQPTVMSGSLPQPLWCFVAHSTLERTLR